MSEEPKPNYVVFDRRAVEDRAASMEAGHYVAKDVDFVLVTPAGTRDRLEKEVTDWFLSLEEGVKQERIPASWLQAYRSAYKQWKETQEVPEFGTSILQCSLFSPAQIKMIQAANIRTIEELAAATEEGLSRIGMGGRALKSKAQAWLDSADTGKTTAELDSMRIRNEALEADNADLRKRMEAMESTLASLQSVKEPALISTRK